MNKFQLAIVERELATLTPYCGNPRQHTPKQIRQIAESIRTFGFTNPILIDSGGGVLAGHGRLAAAKQLGLPSVPTICLDHLSAAERRAYIIADNKLGDESRFDRKQLAHEITLILSDDPTFDLEITGFQLEEIELLVDVGTPTPTREEAAPPPERGKPALTRLGDLWLLGRHRLYCGNAIEPPSYKSLMGAERARVIFADLPYNVPAASISGNGKVAHGAFAMASGEMSSAEFTTFLTDACVLMARASLSGSLHYLCMDWRHQAELLAATMAVYDRQIDLCVWGKAQPGMGTPYRQQHELIGVFKRGTRAHVQNVDLGAHGRNRSNLWSYSSGPSFSIARQQELAWHPTCKPVAMVRDAILDASRKDEIVLDPFAGSGTTLIAAEESGRQARLMEIDPHYCDVVIRRFEQATGETAKTADGASLRARQEQTEARTEAHHG